MARTDDDTWDLGSSVGSTATMVAAQRALSHREGLIDDPYAEPLVRAVGLDFFVRALDGEISLDDIDPRFNARRAAEGMAVRTRHFDRLFTDAAAAGVRQAVILAAGLDARAYRLPWPAGSSVFELDQPDVIAFKSDTLAGLGAEATADRRAVAIDLRDDWPKALLANGFDPTQPTAWIAEGLLIYLPPEAQDLLFDRIDELSSPGSRVATEHIPDVSMFSDERSQEIAERLRTYGHDIEMGELIYHGERNDVIDYLTAHGWDVTTQKTRDAYAANGFEFPEDGPMGFFADMSYLSAVKH
ncbi:class I SAM-dependent methyltransferase [Mycolicibacterium celeriflavum]|uniref:S-adenosyl-L-methionine-dependent methyltransferase n=1 Tax=Mycolicibacterium celeriflavum TaxID=1249101 RepID=A0A1X0BYF7_MYCCF|nr:class I SAM-dependent methyltransferase [Mycolicibacterium celeriflavum]MCV7236771.1 class I SAM-dependent methyltransferase [Mycolicibacterium celeriflavum]ORA49577.1 SAM-dependent methyltransferase [Mycolicibacterium celeriflavum]BBY43983.1 putative S-adenosyl-L-methionine-dependent methyltransferase [Mycolicibacterium celeriflavum]